MFSVLASLQSATYSNRVGRVKRQMHTHQVRAARDSVVRCIGSHLTGDEVAASHGISQEDLERWHLLGTQTLGIATDRPSRVEIDGPSLIVG